jgi:prepilin-type N-terminal cleavage/methylation domain-containing protein
MGMRIRKQLQRRNRPHGQTTSTLGFSMVELLVVVAIALIISGFAVLNTQGAIRDSRVNGAYDNAFMQLRLARERSIAERKRYIVTFGTPAPTGALTPLGAPTAKSIQVYRWDAGNPSPAPVEVSTIDLPIDVGFQALAGLPTTTAKVPDGFGNGTTPIDFDQGVGAGGGNLVMFMPDGSAHDLLGNSNSGVLYIARNADLSSSRALTVFGTSGRIRGWRLAQPGGLATWKQQ